MGDPKGADVIPMLTREQRRSRRHREVRARTVPTRNSKLAVRRVTLQLVADGIDSDALHATRPRTRGECAGVSRPCVYVSCRMNTYLDVNRATGSIKLNFPDVEPEGMPADVSCVLDIADRGGSTLEQVGEYYNLTRERVRQLEVKALRSYRAVAPPGVLAEFLSSVLEGDAAPLGNDGGAAVHDANASGSGGTGRGWRNERGIENTDATGLTRRERDACERWSNEVSADFRQGLPLRVAQALAAEPFDGQEDPPVCLAPPIPGDRRTGSREAEVEETDPDAPEERHEEEEPDGTRVPSAPEGRAASTERVEEAQAMGGVSEKKSRELEESREQVRSLLKERGPLSRGQIQSAIGDKRSPHGFGNFLRIMKAGGEIDSRGLKKQCRYFLKGDKRTDAEPIEEKPSVITRHVATRRVPAPASGKVVDSSGTKYDVEQDAVQILQQQREAHLEKAKRIDRAIAALLGQ